MSSCVDDIARLEPSMTPTPFSRQLGSLIVLLATAMSSGCSTLNEWKGPNKDPFFSVLDEPRVTTPTGPKTFQGSKVPSGNGEPVDQVKHTCGTLAETAE